MDSGDGYWTDEVHECPPELPHFNSVLSHCFHDCWIDEVVVSLRCGDGRPYERPCPDAATECESWHWEESADCQYHVR